jgi:heme/copper-type cytochrome/quinol oxidase subunit 4
VEAIVGVILVVISIIEMLWVVRTVQANMPKA